MGSKPSTPVGLGANLTRRVEGIMLNEVPNGGPFTRPEPGEVPQIAVTELWESQPVVLHLLRRFG